MRHERVIPCRTAAWILWTPSEDGEPCAADPGLTSGVQMTSAELSTATAIAFFDCTSSKMRTALGQSTFCRVAEQRESAESAASQPDIAAGLTKRLRACVPRFVRRINRGKNSLFGKDVGSGKQEDSFAWIRRRPDGYSVCGSCCFDGHVQCTGLAYQHDQLFAPGHAGIEQIAL